MLIRQVRQENVLQMKQSIRRQQMERRAGLSKRARKEAAREAARLFISTVPLEPVDIIAGYWPVSNEIDVSILLEMLQEQGYICALPVIQGLGRPLAFRRYEKGAPLQPHPRFGMMEPYPAAPLVVPTVVIAPLVAFDKDGNRLGFGGGFYDRTLEDLSRSHVVFTAGMAYSFQQVAMIPSLPHDQKMDCVITDRGVVVCKQDLDDE